MELHQRIKKAREQAGLNQSELARRLSVSPQSVQQWERSPDEKGTAPRRKRLEQLADVLGVSLIWLTTGQSSPTGDSAPIHDTREFVDIPILDVELAAGSGAHVDLDHVTDYVPVASDWILHNGYTANTLRVVYARGDSMSPRIEDGDLLLVDTADRRPVSGNVYAIAYDEELRVKRLLKQYDGTWAIHSDNPDPAYPDEYVSPVNIGQLRIIGRVVRILMGSI